MYSKFIIVLATLCVANASVVINVFDDDPDIGVQSGVKDCNPTACEQLCRRLKFPGGACVNGRCKCDNFRSENEAVLELSPSDLEAFSTLEVLEESENELSANDCNPTSCDQLCRRLKFPGGACVNGRCKCDNFRNSEEAVLELSPSDLEAFSSLEDEPLSEAEEEERSRCRPSACEQHCRMLKLPGGACVNGRCKCDKFLSEQDGINISAESSKDLVCIPFECDQQCRKIGFTDGACVRNICQCNTSLETGVETFETDAPVPEVTSANLEMDSCGIRSCDFICRSMHMARGYCAAGRCQCFRPAGLVDANSAPVLEPAKNQTHGKCRQRLCDLVCRKLKFERGECLENKCKCYRAKVDVMSAPALEPAKNQTHGKCRQRLCDLVCRKLKYHRGECSDNKCKCYKDGVARDDNEMPKFSEDLTKVKCTKRVCNQMCRSLDYKGGNCKNGKCWCYGPPKKPARLMQADTDDEEEVPVGQDFSAEEEPVAETLQLDSAPVNQTERRCSNIACYQACIKRNFRYGFCFKGVRCQCVKPLFSQAQSVVGEPGKEEQVEQIQHDETTEKAPPKYKASNEEEREDNQDNTTEKDELLSRHDRKAKCTKSACRKKCEFFRGKTVSRVRRASCTKKACNKKCILFDGYCLSGRCICI